MITKDSLRMLSCACVVEWIPIASPRQEILDAVFRENLHGSHACIGFFKNDGCCLRLVNKGCWVCLLACFTSLFQLGRQTDQRLWVK